MLTRHGIWLAFHFKGEVFDYLPESALLRIENLAEFAGAFALDKWLCNCDGRQAVFCRRKSKRRFRAHFIDFGYCFNAGEWNFPDSSLRGIYGKREVYRNITGWHSFEPWLSGIENFDGITIRAIAEDVPPESKHSEPDDFIFPNRLRKGGFIDPQNYRRKMRKLGEELGLPKLTFQVIRRTIATLGQKKGTPKDIQGVLRHSRLSTTTDVYMQEIPESVKATVAAINQELRLKPKTAEAS